MTVLMEADFLTADDLIVRAFPLRVTGHGVMYVEAKGAGGQT